MKSDPIMTTIAGVPNNYGVAPACTGEAMSAPVNNDRTIMSNIDMSPSVEIYSDMNGFNVTASLSPAKAEGHHYVALVGTRVLCQLTFQQGPVRDNGINGLTNEALLTILIHRTEILDTQFPCAENKLALESMKDALWAFNERTNKRVARGVEGTLAP